MLLVFSQLLTCLDEAILRRMTDFNLTISTLPQSIALVSWSCVYTAPDVDTTQGQKWIHEHALKGPATHVRAHGKFHTGLVEPARLLANQEEHSSWCPLGEEVQLLSLCRLGTVLGEGRGICPRITFIV